MSISSQHLKKWIQKLLTNFTKEQLYIRLSSKYHEPEITLRGHKSTPKAIENRHDQIAIDPEVKEALAFLNDPEVYAKNIENLIGVTKVPLGVAGPIRINGVFANDDFLVPLATTEAALVASYHRGCNLITKAGGCTTLILNESVSRAPGFALDNLRDVGLFVAWVIEHKAIFDDIVTQSSEYCELQDMRLNVEGNHVYVLCDYTTGDAAGQNMVTIATQGVFDYILEHSPIPIEYAFVEANMSGDKKASHHSFFSVRGKKATAEVVLSEALIKRYLHTTPKAMEDYWRMSAMGGVMSGTIGVQGHYSNALAAIFIATGQDPACVSEASVGVTRFEVRECGSLYATVTLPNLIVGTIGGGTHLPSQNAALKMMNLAGSGNASALAEVIAGVVLGGELSIIGALAANHFSKAHKNLARGKKS
jgi:hydroxymethylglutaryl-CoA reductase (NADPH)